MEELAEICFEKAGLVSLKRIQDLYLCAAGFLIYFPYTKSKSNTLHLYFSFTIKNETMARKTKRAEY